MKQNLLPAAGLLMSLLLGSCAREAGEKPTTEAQQKTALPEVISFSSLRDGKTEIEYAEKGKQHKVEWQGSKITALFIDGKKVSEETQAMHQAAVQKIMQQLEADRQKMERALIPPKSKGPGAGNAPVEFIDLISNEAKNAPAKEKTDRERAEAERKVANKTGSQE